MINYTATTVLHYIYKTIQQKGVKQIQIFLDLPDAQLSADEIFDKDSFSESIINALPSGL